MININVAKRDGWKTAEAGEKFASLKGIIRRTAISLLELGVETNSSTAARGDVQQELTNDLLDAMNSYEADAMDVFEEGNEEGTNVDPLTAGGGSLVDVAQATVEPLESKEDLKMLQQTYTTLASERKPWSCPAW